MKILALAPYPDTAPSTRFRLAQFRSKLRAADIELGVVPFVEAEDFNELYGGTSLSGRIRLFFRGLARRVSTLFGRDEPDLFLVHREISPLFGGIFLARIRASGVPYVFDFDDPVYLPPQGGDPLLNLMRRPRRVTAGLCKDAAVVLAGNAVLADFARQARGDADDDNAVRVLPTVIDTERFRPAFGSHSGTEGRGGPVVGWIGSHTTLPELISLYPVLRRARRQGEFRLRVVCNRPPPGDSVLQPEFVRWTRDAEVRVVQELDIGLYPLASSEWNRAKCGFKAIQYLACGVPTVASPVGVLSDIIEHGESGFLVSDPEEWVDALTRLRTDSGLRKRMGRNGRERIVSQYSVRAISGRLERALKDAVKVDDGRE